MYSAIILLTVCIAFLILINMIFLSVEYRINTRIKRGKKITKKSLIYILKDILNVCHHQHSNAMDYLNSFSCSKVNDVSNVSLSLLLPESLTKPIIYIPVIFDYFMQENPLTTITRLFKLRDAIQLCHDNLQEYTSYYAGEIKLQENVFYQNILELSKMHDELRKYINVKNHDKNNGSEWYKGYFSIFETWARNGVSNDMEVMHKEIVIEILALNKLHRHIPFVILTSECALSCENAYNNVFTLNKLLEKKLNKYAYYSRLSYRTARVILKTFYWKQKNDYIQNDTIPVVRDDKGLTYTKFSTESKSSDEPATSAEVNKPKPSFTSYLWIAVILGIIVTAGYLIYALTWARPIKISPFIKPYNKVLPNRSGILDSAPPQLPATALNTLYDTINFKILFDSAAKLKTSVYGVDISKYQGNIIEELPSLDTLHFLICKATEGGTNVDPDFSTNWEYIKQKGLIRGAYHFFHSEDAPIKQAELFLKTIHDFNHTDIPPIVDVEEGSLKSKVTAAGLDSSLLVFLDHIQKKLGRKPIVYTNYYFANRYLISDSLSNFSLWVAEYSNRLSPMIPRTWKKKGYVIWQRSDSYDLDSDKSDFDIFNGNGQAFIDFIKGN